MKVKKIIGKKVLKYLIVGCIGIMFLGIISNTNNVYAYTEQPKITLYKKDIYINKGTSLDLYYGFNTYYGGKINWLIYNESVATAREHFNNNHFTIIGNKVGNTSIRVWLNNRDYDTCNIHVIDPTTIWFTKSKIVIDKGSSFTLSYSTSEYYSGRISWKIENGDIAGGNANYNNKNITITGKEAGYTSIKIWLENGNYNICNISVSAPKVHVSNVYFELLQKEFTYNGEDKDPGFVIKYNGKKLGYGDYDLKWPKDSTSAGVKVVTLIGKGQFYGEVSRTYRINKRNITGGSIVLHRNPVTGYIYTGGQIKPGIDAVYMPNGKTRVYDYKVEYGTNTNSGQGWVKVTGTNNNTGSITKYFTINKRNITGGSIVLHRNPETGYIYTGGQIKPGIDAVYMPNGKTQVYDYKVEYGTNTNSGQGWVKVTGKNNNTGSITKYFTINKRDISGGSIKFNKKFEFTGKKVTPGKEDIDAVYMPNGTTKFYDYKIVSYGKNIRGIGTIKIEGTNNNTGSITQSFIIGGDLEVKNESGDGFDSVAVIYGRNYKNYKQIKGSYANSKYWTGTIAKSGCGPTSIAIIASGYGINKSPLDIANTMTKTNLNELSSALTKIGLDHEKRSDDSTQTQINNIKSNLQKGLPVLVGINAQTGYSPGDHWMAALGMQGDDIIISNPGKDDKPVTENLEEFVTRCMKGCWYILITKE